MKRNKRKKKTILSRLVKTARFLGEKPLLSEWMT